MTGKGDEPSTTDGLQYPMVDLFTGGTMLPLMFINAAAAWYLLSLKLHWHSWRRGLTPLRGNAAHNPARCCRSRYCAWTCQGTN
jgi:hypothetical protein